jgi:hypothetical protein
MNRTRALVLMLVLTLALAVGAVSAQQATPYPITAPAIGEVSANPSQFYDQEVNLQGILLEFVSPNAFVISDDTVGDLRPLLVINNSGLPLPNTLTKFSQVSLVGRVIPSAAAVADGSSPRLASYYDTRVAMLNDANAPGSDAEPTPNAVAGNAVDPNVVDTGFSGEEVLTLPYQEDMMNWLYSAVLPPEYADYGVIELRDINLLVIAVEEEAVG